MSDASKKILQKIDKEKIQPYSKKHFLIKKSIVWTVFSISILLGIVASSIVIFQLTHTEWDLYRHLNYSPSEFIILAIPYFWLLFLLLFIGLAIYNFRRSERGYRFNTFLLIFLSTILSVVGGGLLYQTGFSAKLENIFQENIPLYEKVIPYGFRMWEFPESGLLAGEITQIKSQQEILITDLQGTLWRVDISQTIWRGRLMPSIGLRIKIIGKMIDKNHFVAHEIRPLQSRRGQGRNRRWGSAR